MEVLILTLIILALLALLLSYDRAPSRVGTLKIDGRRNAAYKMVRPRSWINKRVGLLNHLTIPDNFALWLTGSRCVHTVGMLAPIDIVFLSRGKVVDIRHDTPPGLRRVVPAFGAGKVDAAVEFPAGAASSLKIAVGSTVEFEAQHAF